MAVSPAQMNLVTRAEASVSTPGSLWSALRRLDSLLDAATRALQPSRAGDGSPLFHGLFLTPEQVARLLTRAPGAAEFRSPQRVLADDLSLGAPSDSPIAWVAHAFSLTRFDVDVLLIALAPEIDLRYEKIYGYLQDDITRKRPSVELALNLLCANPEEKLIARAHFASSAPLLRNGLLQLVADGNQTEPPLLAQSLRLDASVTRFLLGQVDVDSRISAFTERIVSAQPWEQLPVEPEILQTLPKFMDQAAEQGQLRCFYFYGSSRTDRREAAASLAQSAGLSLLSVRLDRMTDAQRSDPPWKLLLREARLTGAVLYISDLDDLRNSEAHSARHALLDELWNQPGVTILAGSAAWIPNSTLPVLPVSFDTPDFPQRRACWNHALQSLGATASSADLDKVASRFVLSASQIAQAAGAASVDSKWNAAQSPTEVRTLPPLALSFEQLSAAARNQCGQELSSLALKIDPRHAWEDIILPADPKSQLREICHQAEFRFVVFGEWGFDRKLSLGKGLNVLFSGPPGTGKTMAAEVIANEMALDLYRIDLSQVVSKYIGETEKNLDRIFNAAEQSNAILFFDEADALFGKRSEVRDSHDRYANIEVSYLLQKMEEYVGISILATNLRQNLDEAFVRRLQTIVEFPFPDEHHRRSIWEQIFPREAPLAEDVKFELLAKEVRLAGGNIKNMALAAAFAAAAENTTIHLSHLIQAAHREHQKLSRSWEPGALSKVMAAAS